MERKNTVEIFQHLLSMCNEISAMYKAGLSHILMQHINECSKVQQTDDLSIIYKNAFTAEGIWDLANEWVIRGMEESLEEMKMLFQSQKLLT
ncbi:hypothetical protein [Paenibacillus maysiensis]|uniref:hypothetical protein n=1 Tax=Paenibacillus maysiensis TaxID=1155954 RepID=UPI0004710ABC|nr:hypothetical protein [Paenibacillus maysiensis]